jgi:hypothetical protein
MENLSLSNIAEGSLEQQFQAAYPQILQALKEGGKKATITMKIEFARPGGTTTLAGIKASFDVKMPPNDPRLKTYTFNGSDFRIQSEPVKPLGNVDENVLPFTAGARK